MSRKVFVSFSRKDKRVADSVSKQLRKAGVEVVSGAGRTKDAGIKLHVSDSIKDSDEVIAIVSKNSAHSSWLNFEVGVAAGLGKKLTPILVGVDSRELSPVLRSVRAVNLAKFRKTRTELS